MLLPTLLLSSCVAVLAAPQFAQVVNNGPQPHQMENMFKALDVESMLKTFDPKFVVVNEQKGDIPAGVHDALVKSLISDLHTVDVPVVYAQRRDIPLHNL